MPITTRRTKSAAAAMDSNPSVADTTVPPSAPRNPTKARRGSRKVVKTEETISEDDEHVGALSSQRPAPVVESKDPTFAKSVEPLSEDDNPFLRDSSPPYASDNLPSSPRKRVHNSHDVVMASPGTPSPRKRKNVIPEESSDDEILPPPAFLPRKGKGKRVVAEEPVVSNGEAGTNKKPTKKPRPTPVNDKVFDPKSAHRHSTLGSPMQVSPTKARPESLPSTTRRRRSSASKPTSQPVIEDDSNPNLWRIFNEDGTIAGESAVENEAPTSDAEEEEEYEEEEEVGDDQQFDKDEDVEHGSSDSTNPDDGASDKSMAELDIGECVVTNSANLDNPEYNVCKYLKPTYANAPPLSYVVEMEYGMYQNEEQFLVEVNMSKTMIAFGIKSVADLRAVAAYISKDQYGTYWSNPARQDPNSTRWRVLREGFVLHGLTCAPSGVTAGNGKCRRLSIFPFTFEWWRALSFWGSLYDKKMFVHKVFQSGLSTYGLGKKAEEPNLPRGSTVSPTKRKSYPAAGSSQMLAKDLRKYAAIPFDLAAPVYDARAHFAFTKGKKERPENLDFDKLDTLPRYNGELPTGSFVSVLVTPNAWGQPTQMGINLYAVVLLRVPSPIS